MQSLVGNRCRASLEQRLTDCSCILLLLLLQVEHATAARVKDLEKQLDAATKRADVRTTRYQLQQQKAGDCWQQQQQQAGALS